MNWIIENKEWLFSGAAIVVIGLVIQFLKVIVQLQSISRFRKEVISQLTYKLVEV